MVRALGSADCFPCSSIDFICFSFWFSVVSVYFSNAFPEGEQINLACSIIPLWFAGVISSPAKYSYLSILHSGNADIFAASMLIAIAVFHL